MGYICYNVRYGKRDEDLERHLNNLNSAITPLFVGGERCRSGHSFGPAVRTHYLLHYVISGTGTYSVGGNVYPLSEGQAFLIKPGEVTLYKADVKNPWCYVWVALRTELEEFKSLPYVIENRELSAIMQRYSHVERIYKLNDFHAAALTWSVAACLAEPKYNTENTTDYTNRAISIIEQHYTGNITVQGIADTLNIDRSYFSNLFKKDTGLSPQQYLIAHRLRQSLELLREDRYTISVVAASVGFSDLFTFSRCFKKHYGVPPTEYKKLL